jgi:hypothetical protein
MELLKKYQARMSEFCNVDDTTLSDRLKKVPEEKHFWNTQFVDSKIALWKLEKQRKTLDKGLAKKVTEDSPVELNKKALDALVKGGLEEIDDKIQEQKFLIEWLELNTKTVSFMAHDFKNIIELKKIEEI